MKKKNASLGRGLGDLFSEAEQAMTTIPAQEDGFANLPVKELRLPDWMNARNRHTDSLEDLAFSIRDEGVLQPLLVRKTESGYDVVSGARRYAAAIQAGLAEIPCVICKAEADELLDMYLHDNLLRLALSLEAEDPSVAALCAYFDITPGELRERVAQVAPERAPDEEEQEAEPPPEEEVLDAPEGGGEVAAPDAVRGAVPYKRYFQLTLAALVAMAFTAFFAARSRRAEPIIREVLVEVPVEVPASVQPEEKEPEERPGRLLQTYSLPRFWAPPAMLNNLPFEGILLRYEPQLVNLHFQQAVFTGRNQISPEARGLLRRIAGAIKPYAAGVGLQVVGGGMAPESGERALGPYAAGLQRAAAAAHLLRVDGGLPAERIHVMADEESSSGDLVLRIVPVYERGVESR